MDQNPKQLAVDTIKNGKKFLVLTSQNSGGAIGTVLALSEVLNKLGKETTSFCPTQISERYNFLPLKENLKTSLESLKNFVIVIDTREAKVEKLAYNLEGDKLKIHLTPTSGIIDASKVSFETSQTSFDAIITINTKKLDELGVFYETNNDLFFKVPVVNIDYRDGNNYFGKVNLVDTKATSSAETVLSIIESLSTGEALLDENIATNLLTALVEDTNSFQSANTTPKAFSVAAQLVGAGAKQQEIISHLYSTKSVLALRLWGRVLAGLREDKELDLVWSIVSERDLEATGANHTDIQTLMPEFFTSTQKPVSSKSERSQIVFLLWEKEGKYFAELKTNNGEILASQIASAFGATGTDNSASINIISSGLGQAERDLINKIKELKGIKVENPPAASQDMIGKVMG